MDYFVRHRRTPVQLRRRWAAAAAVLPLLLVCLAAAPALARGLFQPQTFTLGNGLEVIVVTDRRVPVVSHMLWYKAGAADEPAGRSGIAHFLEHLMFKGTPKVPQGEFSRIVASNGGQENAFTSYDYTAFYQNIARDRLELMMRMEADRMHNLTLTDEQVASERQVVLEERSQTTDNDPAAVLDEEAQAAKFLNHPYRRPVIGWQQEIATLTADDARQFYRTWYAPNNAILVVTGDVDAAELRPLAERTYGKVRKIALPPPLHLLEPGQRAERRVSLSDPRVRQPEWSRSYRAPSYSWGKTEHAYALQLVADILGGGATSRLYRSLIVEQGLAVSASAWYDPSKLGPSELVVDASPRPEVSFDRLEAAIETIVREMAASGATEEELARAKRRTAAGAIMARDSYATAAYIIGAGRATGQSLTDIEAWPERIEAVSRDQVAAASRLVLSGPSVTALLAAAGDAADHSAEAPPPPSPPARSPASGGIR